MTIMSIEEIAALMRAQGNLRAEENDEAGVLLRFADQLEADVLALDAPCKPAWLWVHPLQPYNVGYHGVVAGATAVS